MRQGRLSLAGGGETSPGNSGQRPRLERGKGGQRPGAPGEGDGGAPEGEVFLTDGRAVNPGRREVGRPEVLGDGGEGGFGVRPKSQEGLATSLGLWDAEGVGVMTAWRGFPQSLGSKHL